ncbi:MAG TPA: glycosyltransferase family 4 protein, partial [Myxococcaceae bacterium]|nr:glycosyltransferase family 4 protein [Myxococcaceae bacterium]
FPLPLMEFHLTKDPGLLALGVEQAGHEPLLLCPEAGAFPPPEYLRVVPRERLGLADFWFAQRVDLALVYTWLDNSTDILRALRAAGVPALSKGDSDGQLGLRVHPLATLRRTVLPHASWGLRARAGLYWLRRYARAHRPEEQAILDNLEQARLTLLETEAARGHLQRFLEHAGRPELGARVRVLPNPVAPRVLETPVPARKVPRVLAVGRWDDVQKDAPLLSRALERFAAAHPEVEVELIGPGGADCFGPLTRRHRQVRYLGPLPHAQVLTHLAPARTLVFSSRWEGAPIAANEALALGCTVVGPPLPAFRGLAAQGDFGVLARERSPRGLAEALGREMEAWAAGRREPARVAGFWRERVAPLRVVESLLALHRAAEP